MNGKLVLAIDLGSTFFKAGLFTAKLEMVGCARAAIQYRFGSDGLAVFDVDHAEEAFRTAIGDALERAGAGADDLCALGITSQAQTFTVVDAAGRPQYPFISWQDTRPRAFDLPELPGFAAHCGFSEQAPGLTLSHLLRIRAEAGHAEVKDGALVLPLPTYFVWRLTNVSAIDPNLAGMTGLFSITTNTWWDDALRRCDLPETSLPKIAPLGAVTARTTGDASAWGLRAGIPVVLAGNDQTAGAWGANINSSNQVLITLGTAQVAYRCLNEMPSPRTGRLRGPYLDEKHYELIADDYGANLVDWAETLLLDASSDTSFFDLAAQAPAGCDGLIFDADLNHGLGAWRGIARSHTVHHFARAVLECLVQRMAGMVRELCPEYATSSPMVAGGGSRHKLWVDMLSRELGARLEITSASPLLGAARMAKLGFDKTS